MEKHPSQQSPELLMTQLSELAACADYSLLDELDPDPQATADGSDHRSREVVSGHYVPVKPTPIAAPEYVAHSPSLFAELGLADSLAQSPPFVDLFSGNMTQVPEPLRKYGWATGYALSIYGTEYVQQCPFQTGNGYGDGRAMSVLEAVVQGKRWEMQLKGGGPTPYCRGADGRAVLRSSIREFLAQEHMHALGIATSRSLCLFASTAEAVNRPWYSPGSRSPEPDIMESNPVAITTRVAPSFLRVGQLELFGRRARDNAHPAARAELQKLFLHLMKREYSQQIKDEWTMADKLLTLAVEFRDRLAALVTAWLRVGYCQGNFNSDNCAVGGFTLDYGPFGFCEQFDPHFQPWIGGGQHFSFLNQIAAAEQNYGMFCTAMAPLLAGDPDTFKQLQTICAGFSTVIEQKINTMWASKLGMDNYDSALTMQLLRLMVDTGVDYNLFFRELSQVPTDVGGLGNSFYQQPSASLLEQWSSWLQRWRSSTAAEQQAEALAAKMKRVNPKYSWREWQIVPAYQSALHGDYSLVRELQQVLTHPYEEQSQQRHDKYYQRRPSHLLRAGGISHYSCSS